MFFFQVFGTFWRIFFLLDLIFGKCVLKNYAQLLLDLIFG